MWRTRVKCGNQVALLEHSRRALCGRFQRCANGNNNKNNNVNNNNSISAKYASTELPSAVPYDSEDPARVLLQV